MTSEDSTHAGRFKEHASSTVQGRLAELVAGFALAFFITGAPVMLHLIGQPVAILFCLAAAGVVTRNFEQHVPIVLLTANIFQNVFVSLLSPYYSDFREIEPLKSYSFLTTIFLWAGAAFRFLNERGSYSPLVKRMIYASIATLAIVGIYFVAGLAIDARNSVIYMRNIGLPLLMFQLFLVTGAKRRVALPSILAILLALVMVCGYLELASAHAWLTLTNGWAYHTLNAASRLVDLHEIETNAKEGVVITNVLDYSTTKFLNIGLPSAFDFKVTRLQGPNIHPISFGYLLATLITFSLIDGAVIIGALAAPLLFATSAKGPIVLFLASLGVFWLSRRTGARRAVIVLLSALVAYSVFVIQSGMQNGDYHVLGLFGGLNGFFKMPIGHSLGDGGNLSLPDFNVDWGKAQQEGATDLAVESAVGVLFFQLGFMAAAVLAFYAWVAKIAWRLYAETQAPALAFAGGATLVLLANGLFQEEAYFSPLSLPLLMALVGLILGSTDRELARRRRRQTGSPPPRAPRSRSDQPRSPAGPLASRLKPT